MGKQKLYTIWKLTLFDHLHNQTISVISGFDLFFSQAQLITKKKTINPNNYEATKQKFVSKPVMRFNVPLYRCI